MIDMYLDLKDTPRSFLCINSNGIERNKIFVPEVEKAMYLIK